MARKTASLADQLAELDNVRPVYNNDAFKHTGSDEAGTSSDDDDSLRNAESEARRHAQHNAVQVGTSKMRRRANLVDLAQDNDTLRKYKGARTTAREMFGDSDASEDEGQADGLSGSSGEGTNDESDVDDIKGASGEETDSDDVSGLHGSEQDSLSGQEMSDDRDSTDAEMSDEQPAVNGKSVRFAALQSKQDRNNNAAHADAELLKKLQEQSENDARRGRHVRVQLDTWGRLLGLRIREQKVVRSAGRLTVEALASIVANPTEDDRQNLDEGFASLDQISTSLLQLQKEFLRADDPAQGTAGPAKRKLSDAAFDRHQADALDSYTKHFAPMWQQTLANWSMQGPAANGAQGDRFEHGGDGGGGLKAINAAPHEQVARAMTGDAFERLQRRTRVWRGTEKEPRLGKAGTADDGADADADADADVFDDSDFYAALLREFIESKGGSKASTFASEGDGEDALAWAQASKRAAKKSRLANENGRTSKGRKLRFDVHEKVEHFMPPIPTERWDAEQIERFMQQLRSRSAKAETGPATTAGKAVDLGGLRLFG